MHFQWYPGHMTKARRMMEENLKLVDLIIELVDARVPMSSRNPDIHELGRNKSRLILLNKADLAEETATDAWVEYFQKQGARAVKVNSRKGGGLKSIQAVIQEACKEKMERDRRRGILNRPVRAMVVGIPNVGKSTFINTLAGKACAKTGNKPGVTKGKQWIRLNKQVELLDTPGILWPKFEDQTAAGLYRLHQGRASQPGGAGAGVDPVSDLPLSGDVGREIQLRGRSLAGGCLPGGDPYGHRPQPAVPGKRRGAGS